MKNVFGSLKRRLRLAGWLLGLFLAPFELLIPKRRDYWIFPVYFIGKGDFTDNNLAVFEEVKNDPGIRKIILTREAEVSVEGCNVTVVPMGSLKAVWYIMRSKIIFVQHSVWLDLMRAKYQVLFPLGRHIINLWHGIAIKDISHANTGLVNARVLREMPTYKVISSSETDSKNMQKTFYATPAENIWITGLPRNDFLLKKLEELPCSFRREIEKLRGLLEGKRLILYAPTYRETNVNGTYYEFTEAELDRLEEYLVRTGSLFGVRYHIYRRPEFYRRLTRRKNILDLSAEEFSDVRLIIRESSAVITDYSSLYVDALYIEKRCIGFAYDLDHYLNTQRGFFYDYKEIFPGEICESFDSLMCAMENVGRPFTEDEEDKLKKIQSVLFKYLDCGNSVRVVERVRALG